MLNTNKEFQALVRQESSIQERFNVPSDAVAGTNFLRALNFGLSILQLISRFILMIHNSRSAIEAVAGRPFILAVDRLNYAATDLASEIGKLESMRSGGAAVLESEQDEKLITEAPSMTPNYNLLALLIVLFMSVNRMAYRLAKRNAEVTLKIKVDSDETLKQRIRDLLTSIKSRISKVGTPTEREERECAALIVESEQIGLAVPILEIVAVPLAMIGFVYLTVAFMILYGLHYKRAKKKAEKWIKITVPPGGEESMRNYVESVIEYLRTNSIKITL